MIFDELKWINQFCEMFINKFMLNDFTYSLLLMFSMSLKFSDKSSNAAVKYRLMPKKPASEANKNAAFN